MGAIGAQVTGTYPLIDIGGIAKIESTLGKIKATFNGVSAEQATAATGPLQSVIATYSGTSGAGHIHVYAEYYVNGGTMTAVPLAAASGTPAANPTWTTANYVGRSGSSYCDTEVKISHVRIWDTVLLTTTGSGGWVKDLKILGSQAQTMAFDVHLRGASSTGDQWDMECKDTQ